MKLTCCRKMKQHKLKIFFIESASAGYLSYHFSLNKFSGNILLGGIVSYDLMIKKNMLKVNSQFIRQHSPESKKMTEKMISQTRKIVKSDIYVACTGLTKAGGSETKTKPVGTFFYVIFCKNKLHHFKIKINGTPKKRLHKLIKKIDQSIFDLLCEYS